MTHDTNRHDSHPTQSDFLSGPQIIPRRIKPGMTVVELIDQQFQAYNSARLNEAAHLYAEEMLAPEKELRTCMLKRCLRLKKTLRSA